MTRSRPILSTLLLTMLSLSVATSAEAQWYFAGYLGANKTASAPVSIDVPTSNISLVFDDVAFAARPFESPQYYGWRLGTLMGPARRFGVEIEFIHLKVIGLTGRAYETTGSSGAITLGSGLPMSTIVERYSMTHGLNFLVVNFVARQTVAGRRASFVARAGAGPTIPHTETTVLGSAVDKYEYAGFGLHAAAGLDVRLAGRLSFLAEYKVTRARPEITVAGGTGQTTALTHQVAAGVAFGFSR
jgi:hypothetical protein